MKKWLVLLAVAGGLLGCSESKGDGAEEIEDAGVDGDGPSEEEDGEETGGKLDAGKPGGGTKADAGGGSKVDAGGKADAGGGSKVDAGGKADAGGDSKVDGGGGSKADAGGESKVDGGGGGSKGDAGGGTAPPNPGAGGDAVGKIGAACTEDVDCGTGAKCLKRTSVLGFIEIKYPDGFCGLPCADDAVCGAKAACPTKELADEAPEASNCLLRCTEAKDCRNGYMCKPLSIPATKESYCQAPFGPPTIDLPIPGGGSSPTPRGDAGRAP